MHRIARTRTVVVAAIALVALSPTVPAGADGPDGHILPVVSPGTVDLIADGPGQVAFDLESTAIVDRPHRIPMLPIESDADHAFVMLLSASDPLRFLVWTWTAPECWAWDATMFTLGFHPFPCGPGSGVVFSSFPTIPRPNPTVAGYVVDPGRYLLLVGLQQGRHLSTSIPLGDGHGKASLETTPLPEIEPTSARVDGRRFIDVPEYVEEVVTVPAEDRRFVVTLGRLDASHQYSTHPDKKWSSKVCFGPVGGPPGGCVGYAGEMTQLSGTYASMFGGICAIPAWCPGPIETRVTIEQPSLYSLTLISIARIPWGDILDSLPAREA